MHQPKQLQSVVHFYETHPISEYEILEKLRADGIELEGLTEEILKDYDQDHFGGLEAVDVLAEKAGITSGTRVLDVCSGMGGPARYLAHRLGCRVTGLDITPSRHERDASDPAGRARPVGRLPPRQCARHALCGRRLRRRDRPGGVRARAGQAAPDRRMRPRGEAGWDRRVHRHPAAGTP